MPTRLGERLVPTRLIGYILYIYIYACTVPFRKYPGCINEGRPSVPILHIEAYSVQPDSLRLPANFTICRIVCMHPAPSFMHPGYFLNGTVCTVETVLHCMRVWRLKTLAQPHLGKRGKNNFELQLRKYSQASLPHSSRPTGTYLDNPPQAQKHISNMANNKTALYAP